MTITPIARPFAWAMLYSTISSRFFAASRIIDPLINDSNNKKNRPVRVLPCFMYRTVNTLEAYYQSVIFLSFSPATVIMISSIQQVQITSHKLCTPNNFNDSTPPIIKIHFALTIHKLYHQWPESIQHSSWVFVLANNPWPI